MGFLDKLKGLFAGSPSSSGHSDPNGLLFHFRCQNCKSLVRIRVDKRNDLNREDGPGTFLLRKEIMDDKCFRLMAAEIWLDKSYRVVTADVTGGELVPQEEYEASHNEPAQ